MRGKTGFEPLLQFGNQPVEIGQGVRGKRGHSLKSVGPCGSKSGWLPENFPNYFENETGIKIRDTTPVDFGKLRGMVERGNVSGNIPEIGGQDGSRVPEMALAEPIDPKIIDRSKFQPQAQ